MRISTIIATSFVVFYAQLSVSQSFTTLATDIQGDAINDAPDAKSISYALSTAQDSLWFQIETYDDITGNWGFIIGIDNNLSSGDGQIWQGVSILATYDVRLIVTNHQLFPFFEIEVENADGDSIAPLDFKMLSPTKVQFGVKLSAVDSDVKMNVLAASTTFSAQISDDLTDTYLRIEEQATGIVENEGKMGLTVFPNPAIDKVIYWKRQAQYPVAIELRDPLGRLIYNIRTADLEGQIDLSNAPAGMYFLQVDEAAIEKIFIN